MMNYKKNLLSKTIIFRFGQIEKHGAGIEEHLNIVDKHLTENDNISIVRTYIEKDQSLTAPYVDPENNNLIWLPLHRISLHNGPVKYDPSPFIELLFMSSPNSIKSVISKVIGDFINNFSILRKQWLRNQYIGINEKINALLKKHQIRLAVFHTILGRDEAELMSKFMKLDIPIVIIYHFNNKRLRKPIEYLMASKAIALGLVSKSGVPASLNQRCQKIIEGIDSEYFKIEDISSLDEEKERQLLFLPGRIDPSKGQLDAIQMIALLRKNGFDVKLLLAGRIESQSYYKKMLYTIKLSDYPDSVTWLGDLTKEQILFWYKNSSIVILPSYSEGLPRTLLEAQLMQRPVVAYDVGGVNEALIDGKTGFLIEKGNIQLFANKVAYLLRDKALMNKMGQSGRLFVSKHYSIDKMVESHKSLYLKALILHELSKK